MLFTHGVQYPGTHNESSHLRNYVGLSCLNNIENPLLIVLNTLMIGEILFAEVLFS